MTAWEQADERAEAARTLGLEVAALEIRRADDIAPAFEGLKGSRVEALYTPPNPLVNTNRIRIGTLAMDARLPTMFGVREYVESGGLMSYGPNVPDHRQEPSEALTAKNEPSEREDREAEGGDAASGES